MRTSEGEGGELRLAVRLRDALAQTRQYAPSDALVVLRLLMPRSAQTLELEDRIEAVVALAERVRSHVRAEDEIVVEPAEGLGIIIGLAHADAADAIAGRLQDALAPLGRNSHRSAQSRRAPRPRSAAPNDARLSPLLRLGLGYATLDTGDPHSADVAIRAAWKPRILISLPLAALRSGDAAGIADATGHSLSAAAREDPASASRVTGLPYLRLVRLESPLEKEDEALREHAKALGVPFARLPARFSASCCRALSPALARELRAVVIGRTRDALTVAMADPRDANAALRLRAATGLAIFPVLAAAEEIERALDQLR